MHITRSPSEKQGPRPWHALLIVGAGLIVFVGVILAIFFLALPAWKRHEYQELQNGDKELKMMHSDSAV